MKSKPPYFNHSEDLFIVDKKPLVFYMNTACKKYPDEFTTYSATYFPKLGFFIDSINGLAGDWGTDKSYWRILNFSQPLSVGVSSYVPRPGDNIVFNFTIYEKGNCTDHETTTETPSKMSSNPQVVTSTQKFRYTVCNDTMKTCCPPSVRLGIEDKQPLIYYMEKACDKYPKKFKKFTVSYKQSLNGYVVVAINEVIGNRDEKTIWRILNATGRVDLGASSYVPTPDDEITLRFENQDKSTPCPNNCNGCCHIL
ncbi:uncharacterized protein LOC128238273 [Mya arenaria]|uniref:uncharacterized protein LOC128238273 n=1 Tax=Mya arenaria TaxID=6604 RepID=UPI0022E09233|nr:uncharacterized protein LOC128238273 [Mya arenaria]XP_052809968.1 uncharacterized protein LOC128238273 [Mya arenaria]